MKPTFAQRFRYWFDNVMAKGTGAVIVLLAILTVLLVVVIAVLVLVFGVRSPEDFFDVVWGNLMRTLDPGTMGADEGWGFRIFMLLVTLGGLFIVASLIGVIASAFDQKIDELRKGRSTVIERDHTLILGWSDKVFQIVNELCTANESRGKAAIVILADKDKVEMEDILRSKVPNRGKTRIVCRSGSPMDLTDLELVAPHEARSIIVLAPEDSDDPDVDVIKTTLALTNNPRRKNGRYHIVGELREPANLETAKLVGRDEADWVVGAELISRITVQTCRQSGLSLVYTELLDFAGHEIYFTSQPSLAGMSYAQAQLAFDDSVVIGIVHDGAVTVNPAPDAVLETDDQLIVIAEDDSTIRLGSRAAVPDESAFSAAEPPPARPERTLILGANPRLPAVLAELDQYVTAGSEAVVVADHKRPSLPELSRLAVRYERGDTTSRAVLERLEPAGFDHIIVLADSEHRGTQRADARTLVTLLNLRELSAAAERPFSVVSEMLDDRNRELAEVTQADDFIVSDRLISLMLSQLSEHEKINDVFEDLFDPGGSEIYLRPASDYVLLGTPLDFATVTASASRRGETAIGYRIIEHARSAADSYGVVVNPVKTARLTFAPGDRVIVLAES